MSDVLPPIGEGALGVKVGDRAVNKIGDAVDACSAPSSSTAATGLSVWRMRIGWRVLGAAILLLPHMGAVSSSAQRAAGRMTCTVVWISSAVIHTLPPIDITADLAEARPCPSL